MPFASKVAPHATLIGLRGRSTEEGSARWFRRFGPLSFDQNDIRSEAEAFAAFIKGAVEAYGLNLQYTTFIGYSNGANLLAATVQLYPGLIRNAVLLRAINVLEETPEADLGETRIFAIAGDRDPFRAQTHLLEKRLRTAGAEITVGAVSADHEIGPHDIDAVQQWLTA
jgi:phospholipase/carboxylesterase